MCMHERTDIPYGTDLGVLYNTAQANNIKAEVLRCKEIGMDTTVFESPVKTCVQVKDTYNSSGTCYGDDYLFSAESIVRIRDLYERKLDITNLIKVRQYETRARGTSERFVVYEAIFDAQSILEIWTHALDGYDPSFFMELTRTGSGEECDWPRFRSSEINEIATAIRLGFNVDVLLESVSDSNYWVNSCRHHAGTMRLLNQAMARNLLSLKFLLMVHPGGDQKPVFEFRSQQELNWAALGVPQVFDIITRLTSEGVPVYDYLHMFFTIRAYANDIPSKELFAELDATSTFPKLDWFEMREILEQETGESWRNMKPRVYMGA